jgi:hypothetical protein
VNHIVEDDLRALDETQFDVDNLIEPVNLENELAEAALDANMRLAWLGIVISMELAAGNVASAIIAMTMYGEYAELVTDGKLRQKEVLVWLLLNCKGSQIEIRRALKRALDRVVEVICE